MSPCFTAEEELFRLAARSWLVENAPRAAVPQDERAQVEFLRSWQAALARDRLVGVHWPEQYGGRGLSWTENFIVQEEMA
ncbi:MAG: acyl-CoA dehydrogenase family protein, partial [Acidimicrobiales bacterium]